MTDAATRSVPPRPARVAAVSLADLAELVGVPDPGGQAAVSGITLSSQRVCPGDLYAALPGTRTHGAVHSAAAAQAGAVAVLTDPNGRTPATATGMPVLVVERPRSVLGALSAHVYGNPAERLTTVGVTGTSGKTTTTHLAEAGAAAAGRTPAVVGTNGTRIAGSPVPSTLTTPEAPDLHALFALMVERGADLVAMEVSSHALVQGRVDGVRFDVAVFLNLGHDHLDFHTDMEDYFAAKAALFTPQRCHRAVIAVDDQYGARLAAAADVPVVTCSATGADAHWGALDVETDAGGSRFVVATPDGRRLRGQLRMPGAFNVANALAAVAALSEVGVPPEEALAGIAAARGVDGRMQRVDSGQDYVAVVDYAHKPEALEAVLHALRSATEGRLVVVLGAGGERDRDKRPVMGRLAAEIADVVVVTDDNPRGEDPAVIRAAILTGTRAETAHVEEVPDRVDAIRRAVGLAGPGDCVLVAGKGHESGQEVSGAVHPFDDRSVLAEAIATREAAR